MDLKDRLGKAACHLIAFEEKTGCSFFLFKRKMPVIFIMQREMEPLTSLKWRNLRTIRQHKEKAALLVGLEYLDVNWLFWRLGPCQELRREVAPGD